MLIELLRKKTPAEKLAIVDDAFEMARQLTMTGLRLRHPDAKLPELEALYLEHLLSPGLAREVLAVARGRRALGSGPDRDAQRRG